MLQTLTQLTPDSFPTAAGVNPLQLMIVLIFLSNSHHSTHRISLLTYTFRNSLTHMVRKQLLLFCYCFLVCRELP